MFLLRQKYDNMNAEAAEQDQSLYMSRLILLYTREREREREIEREREREREVEVIGNTMVISLGCSNTQ